MQALIDSDGDDELDGDNNTVVFMFRFDTCDADGVILPPGSIGWTSHGKKISVQEDGNGLGAPRIIIPIKIINLIYCRIIGLRKKQINDVRCRFLLCSWCTLYMLYTSHHRKRIKKNGLKNRFKKNKILTINQQVRKPCTLSWKVSNSRTNNLTNTYKKSSIVYNTCH